MAAPILISWCVTCDVPEHKWDPTDPLHTPGGPQCPGCTRADIDADKQLERRDDQ